MKKAYIYPVSARDKNLGLYNPYLDDFIESGNEYFEFVNKDHPSNSGIFNIGKYLFSIDYVFLNWIEKVPELKGGYLQSYFILFLLRFSKMLGFKVIWTMHNKLAHSNEHQRMKTKIFKSLLKHSYKIITHSSEGIAFGEALVPGSKDKIFYLPHPVKDRRLLNIENKENDILIWGTIAPYKGVDKFLDYLFKQGFEGKYSIKIIGKITDPTYAKKLDQYKSPNIQIQSAFIEDDELRQLIANSRVVLFTYSTSSILSSGVLMDSLGYGARILSPKVGAFADLAKEGVVENYNGFEELFGILDNMLSEAKKKEHPELETFLKNNSWKSFSMELSTRI